MNRSLQFAPMWIALPTGISVLLATIFLWQIFRASLPSAPDGLMTALLALGIIMSLLVSASAALIQAYRHRERELKQSYQLLREVTENTVDVVYAKDRHGRYLMINGPGARLIGKDQSEIIGKLTREVIPSAFAMETERTDERVIAEGKASTFEQEGIVHGQRRVFQSTKSAYRDPEGRIIGLVGVVRDITDRKLDEERVQQSEEQFRRIFNEAPVGMVLTDLDSRLPVKANESFLKLLGYDREQLFGRTMGELTHSDQRVQMRQLVDRLASGEIPSLRLEKHYLNKQGETVWGDVSLILLRNLTGQPLYLLSMVVDITARKKAEEALRSLNETLEQRVAERTRAAEARAAELAQSREDLQKLAGDLARSNEELQHFAHIASHDLQEPLRMVTSYLTLLSRRSAGALDKQAQEFIGFAVDGSKRMKLLIDDLLLFSRVGSRGQELTPVSCSEALQMAISDLKLALEEAEARVEAEALPEVVADKVQVAQLFQNLIGNAIKFRGSEPPRIRITVRQDGEHWLFAVSDNGIGFEMQFAERIFEIFQRLHSHEEYPGTGVGLAICKKIVERHAGRIWAVSQPRRGTTFYFTFPVPLNPDNSVGMQR